jgi:hypothetical protein
MSDKEKRTREATAESLRMWRLVSEERPPVHCAHGINQVLCGRPAKRSGVGPRCADHYPAVVS